MKTLYISDLDGTLLRPDQTVSPFTAAVIEALAERGIPFAYATARSAVTARKAVGDLKACALAVYNGAFAYSAAGERLAANFFTRRETADILGTLLSFGIFPIVYSYRDGRERFSYIRDRLNEGLRAYLLSRKGDQRKTAVFDSAQLADGDVFYFTCIGDSGLSPAFQTLTRRYQCLFTSDPYDGRQWLEVLPQNATKANAARLLQTRFGCERMVAFGDGENDLPLISTADYACAPANALPSVRAAADEVIAANDADGVAAWLLQNVLS